MDFIEPATEQEVADIIRSSDGPLAITGGGTRGVRLPGQVLSTRGLSGISLYEPGALTMVAKAGTTLQDIETALEEHGQILPFEPYDLAPITGSDSETTIGGIFATNASGHRRLQVGAARDFLLGARFVTGDGAIVKNGGRVMKNVTGYDLVKLMAGSYGTLGVLTEVSFKVLPRPRYTGWLVGEDVSPEIAVRAMTKCARTPYDISGAWYDMSHRQMVVRLEGFDASVRYRAEQLTHALNEMIDVSVLESQPVAPSFLTSRLPGDIWRISCKPTDAPQLAERLGVTDQLFDWAGGRIWVSVPEGTDVRALLGKFDGGATIIRAADSTISSMGRFQPENPGLARLSAGLRSKFDPRGILNKGLMN